MPPLATLPAEARRILQLARRDRSAARAAMRSLSLDEQVALVCDAPMARRAELLDLAPEPEELIPALPPAELVFVAKAIGVGDAGWLLAHASPEQIRTCFDLDAWHGDTPDRTRQAEWLRSLAEAGNDALLRATHAMDLELLVLQLQARATVILKPNDDDWSPPSGSITLDGQFYLLPTTTSDDVAELMAILDVLFKHDYWLYFRLLQGAIWESASDAEEWALRWRAGRLQDLGFPPADEAKRIYAWIRRERLADLPEATNDPEVGEWPLPVWLPSLPVIGDEAHVLFRALALLPEPERRPRLYAFLALANRVAVADDLALGDAETLPAALEKAASLASRGLVFLAREHGIEPADALRRATVERLFRVGFQLERSEELGRSEEAGTGESGRSGEADMEPAEDSAGSMSSKDRP